MVCNETRKEEVCEFLVKYVSANAEDKIDLSNVTQSAWIWTGLAVYTPLCVIGIIGNILTLIMFTKFIKKTTTSIFIIALAAIDLLVCTTSLPMALHRLHNGDSPVSNAQCKLERFITFLAIPLSGGILLAIAVDRFLLIYILNKNIVTEFRAKLVVAGLFVICTAAAIPQLLMFSTLVTFSPKATGCSEEIFCDTNICEPIDDYISGELRPGLLKSVVVTLMIMVALFFIIYTLIFARVYKMHVKMASYKFTKNRAAMNNNSVLETCVDGDHNHANGAAKTHEKVNGKTAKANLNSRESSDSDIALSEEVTLMKPANTSPTSAGKEVAPTRRKKHTPHFQTAVTLFLVTCSFVIAYAPMSIMTLMDSCVESDKSKHASFACHRNGYQYFVWRLFFINHVANPLIYSVLNPRFREAIKSCYKKYFCKKSHNLS